MTRRARVRAVAGAVLLWLALGFLTFVTLGREAALNARGVAADATVVSVHSDARRRVTGRREVSVLYETPRGPTPGVVTAWGYGELPAPRETIRVEYDVRKPGRVRRAGDHGDAVVGTVVAVAWVAYTVWALRRLARRGVAGLAP